MKIKEFRSIETILPAIKVNMGGFIVEQALPHPKAQMLDPFLLIHHADKTYPSGGAEKALGVGPHPHRGFSPVTLVFKGSVHHRDTRGNDSIVDAGGIQWMNAGRGIIHSERPSKIIAENGGQMEIIQFWVNSPAHEKMSEPQYFPLRAEDIPKLTLINGLGEAKIVSGDLLDKAGPISSKTELLVLIMDMKIGDTAEIPIPEEYNTLLYNLNGDVRVNSSILMGKKSMAIFNLDGKSIGVKAESNCSLVLLAGAPIHEKVVSYGPYVMNSDKEIWEAMRDYQMGKMGFLVETFD